MTIRHLAVKATNDELLVFYSCIGGAPERIRMNVVRLGPGWDTEQGWSASDPIEVLRAETDAEGAELPIQDSIEGGVEDGVTLNQLRDPAIYSEDDRDYLLYSVAGEAGIGIAEIDILVATNNRTKK
jgi:hypothetical protein